MDNIVMPVCKAQVDHTISQAHLGALVREAGWHVSVEEHVDLGELPQKADIVAPLGGTVTDREAELPPHRTLVFLRRTALDSIGSRSPGSLWQWC
eukprot:2018648-Amphidinium_carterae.1